LRLPLIFAASSAILAACGGDDGGDGATTQNTSTPPPSTVVANAAPVITGTPSTTATQGQGYSFTPAASDANGDALTFSIANRPAWASFSAASGQLNGMPAPGTYNNVTISVSDGQASAQLPAFSITVQAASPANTTPTISGSPSTTATQGQAYSFTPTASDANGDALTFSIANRPAWASFSASSGQLNGMPTPGTYNNVTISVSDGQASAQLPAFNITVQAASPANTAPTISGTPPSAATQGQAYSFTPNASDADNDPLTFSITGRPSWATFSSATGRLSGTPGASHIRTYSNIVISVSDGQASRSLQAFSITVAAAPTPNTAPTISGNPLTTVLQGSTYSFTPTASDADGDPLTFSISNAPSWASFSTSSGRLSGTPTIGTFSGITIAANDGQASTSLVFSIEVLATANGSVTLNWLPPTMNTDGSPLTNLASVRLYWGTTQGNYTESVTLTNLGLTTYVVEQLTPGTWYFSAKAVNAQGVESSFSNAASKTVQ
jgi:hypothetical protein